MFRIPALRVFLVIALVSGVWYGAITWIGAVAGSEFERVQEILHQMGRTTAIVAVALAAIIGLFLYARRRKHEEPVVAAVNAALGAKADPGEPVDLRHAAQLVLEIAYADAGLSSRSAPASRRTCACAGDSRRARGSPRGRLRKRKDACSAWDSA
jgi:hypothetical protein